MRGGDSHCFVWKCACAVTDEDVDEKDAEADADDDDVRSDLMLDDSSLRHFAAGVVDGLYKAMRRKLQDTTAGGPDGGDDNSNCSNIVASADHEIRSHVRTPSQFATLNTSIAA